MILTDLAREMGRRPFQPFTLITVDGQRFTIDHPEFASIDRRDRTLTYHGDDHTRHEIDARLIAQIVAVAGTEPVRATGE